MTTIFLNLDGLLNANDRKRLLRRYMSTIIQSALMAVYSE